MDDVDKASVETESYIAEKLKQHSNRQVKSGLKPAGHCHNCYEDVDDNKLFCNRICADQYELARKYSRV